MESRDAARRSPATKIAIGDRQDGQTTLEYSLVVALIAVGVAAGAIFLGSRAGDEYRKAGTAAPLQPPVAQCDPNYSGACVPPYPPDLDCADVRRLGLQRVRVTGSDPHQLDRDGDGVVCN
jgi:Flp pilus assembly pilin Flp